MAQQDQVFLSYARDDLSTVREIYEGLKKRGLRYAGDYERAIPLWDAVLSLEGDSVIPLHNKGNAFRRLGRYDEALAAYDKALSLDPEQLDTWYNKGNVLSDLDRYDEALTCYDRALTINPNDPGVLDRRQAILDKRNSAEEPW